MAKYEEWIDTFTDGHLVIDAGALDSVADQTPSASNGQILTWQGGGMVGVDFPAQFQFPVGFAVITVANTNPASALGYGTWTSCGSLTNLIGGLLLTLYFWRRTA